MAMSRSTPRADVPIDLKSFAGGVEFGAHDHGDSDEAEPCDEAEDRVDRRRRLVLGVGESLDDEGAEVLQSCEDEPANTAPSQTSLHVVGYDVRNRYMAAITTMLITTVAPIMREVAERW